MAREGSQTWRIMTTVCDPIYGIITLDYTPAIRKIEYEGWFMFRGELREVRDVHWTANGVQIELL